ncbi:hypothetical protein [Hymenobacter properus]|uniref:Uncharacterized protein n=1 Tax=Hymenobacter properus TaxID=2791026 RepID=A0A931BI45_9BACT|nr:hypothetical protein [Hymenobacter properus]MBF9142697.1 hypothetical protein [Hymenobacter properus]MBR7721505.1 hypothetical protein [Microvirga sp. SRT04]
MTKLRRFREWLRPRMPYLNIWLAGAAWTANYCIQVFCQPVAWAAVALVLAFGAFLAWPWLRHAATPIRYAAVFLQGLGLTICGYCVLFMGWGTMLISTLIGFLLFPLLAWVPVVFGLQIIWRLARNPLRGAWAVGLLGGFVLLPAQWWFYRQYRQIEETATRLEQANSLTVDALARELPRSYVAERVVGMHFRYHTRFEELDGWRPPLHDPLLDVCCADVKTRSRWG